MTKPTKLLCAQRRLRSAWASVQSDQSLRCPHEETLGPRLLIECAAKTLIRLGGCWAHSYFISFVMRRLISRYFVKSHVVVKHDSYELNQAHITVSGIENKLRHCL